MPTPIARLTGDVVAADITTPWDPDEDGSYRVSTRVAVSLAGPLGDLPKPAAAAILLTLSRDSKVTQERMSLALACSVVRALTDALDVAEDLDPEAFQTATAVATEREV